MSSNNQIIVIEVNLHTYAVHMNDCVDNEFEPSKETLIKTFKDLRTAISFANDVCRNEMIEYGIAFRLKEEK